MSFYQNLLYIPYYHSQHLNLRSKDQPLHANFPLAQHIQSISHIHQLTHRRDHTVTTILTPANQGPVQQDSLSIHAQQTPQTSPPCPPCRPSLPIQTTSTTNTSAWTLGGPHRNHTLNNGATKPRDMNMQSHKKKNTETKPGEYYHAIPRVGNNQTQTLQMPGSPLRPRNANGPDHRLRDGQHASQVSSELGTSLGLCTCKPEAMVALGCWSSGGRRRVR